MTLSPDDQRRLETTLTSGLQTLLSRAEGTQLAPLANRLRAAGCHITDVRVRIQTIEIEANESPMEKYQRESRIMNEWLRLFKETREYAWSDFVAACSRKIDVTGSWKTVIAQALGISLYDLQYAETTGIADWKWLTKLAKLPDWKPTKQRSNFSKIAGRLVRGLRHAGMSRQEIAQAFTDFLRDFNGSHVTAADVVHTLD